MLFSKQKVIRIIKAKSNKDNIYGIFNKESMLTAMQELSPNGFKLWCYLNCNQNEYEFGLSPIDVQSKCCMGRTTYYRTVDELIEKGYLISVELREKMTGYLFLETGPIPYGLAAEDVDKE